MKTMILYDDLEWTVKIIAKGDTYGLDKCLTNDEDKALVEFYDRSYLKMFGEEGQFVSRYYAETLLVEHKKHIGLNLQDGVPGWQITAAGMEEVRDWLIQNV